MLWSEVVASPYLKDLPFKIELNQWGNIEMSPATNWHASLQSRTVAYLIRTMKTGECLTESPVMTALGVRVPDVSWRSAEHKRINDYDSPFAVAPELCIEVRSESNTTAEFEAKTSAYFAAGAKEVWWVEMDSKVRVFTLAGEQTTSVLAGERPHLG
jgi:Uma2 family endonuclease